MDSASGSPQEVCSRNRRARSSTGKDPNDSRRASLNRWHWQPEAGPRVPRTDWSSSHVASLAGTTETSTFAALMTTSVGPGGAPVVVLVAAATRTTTAPAARAPSLG